jgi:hypothetical protein
MDRGYLSSKRLRVALVLEAVASRAQKAVNTCTRWRPAAETIAAAAVGALDGATAASIC